MKRLQCSPQWLGRRLGPAALILAAATFIAASSEPSKPAAAPKPKLALSIKPQNVADALRAVIQSDREIYARLAAEHALSCTQSSSGLGTNRAAQPLPSPCEMLRLGSQAVATRGVEYSYVLRSLTPTNPRNAPETDVEVKGLQFVSTRPDLSFTSEELLGGRWYFTAVYPDVAVHQSCVDCHNHLRKISSPAFKSGDVLGGLVVRVALEL